jgi:hypothetical protein
MTVTFPGRECKVVREEMLARIRGDNQWKDPHNEGTYTLLDNGGSSGGDIQGSRRTGDGKYTDLFDLALFTTSRSEQPGCVLKACSESQVFSVLDFSTNYCNLFALYCNSADACPVVHHELEYKEEYNSCWQRTKENCLGTATSH